MADKKQRKNIAIETLSTGAGGLAGGLGVNVLTNRQLAPVHKVMGELAELVNTAETADTAKAIAEIMKRGGMDADEASLVVEAIEHTNNKTQPSEEAVNAINKLFKDIGDKELKGFAKFAHNHPRALMAGGVLAGGTLAMGAVSALRGNENAQPQSFTERENARRVEAELSPEASR